MALLTKVDYYNLGGSGWEVSDTSENRAVGYTAEAQGPDGFIVAVDAGGENVAPQVNYVATADATLSGVVLGSVQTILTKKVALGGITITTQAGEAPTMTATGSQIEDNGTAHCTCTLGSISVSGLFHAQNFGLFSIANGQLTSSTLAIEGNINTAMVDGVIKSSDLVGGRITISGEVVGVSDAGAISTPTLTVGTPSGNVGTGTITQPLSQTNPNGDFPTYSFTVEFPLKADVPTP